MHIYRVTDGEERHIGNVNMNLKRHRSGQRSRNWYRVVDMVWSFITVHGSGTLCGCHKNAPVNILYPGYTLIFENQIITSHVVFATYYKFCISTKGKT